MIWLIVIAIAIVFVLTVCNTAEKESSRRLYTFLRAAKGDIRTVNDAISRAYYEKRRPPAIDDVLEVIYRKYPPVK